VEECKPLGTGGIMTLDGFSSKMAGLYNSTYNGSAYINLPDSDARWYVATVGCCS